MINYEKARKYCGEDISAIENYAEAVADKTQVWDLHHRLEVMPWGTYTTQNLKDHGLYYGQPAASLVFMTHSEHVRLHKKGRALSEEHRRRISEGQTGERNHNFSKPLPDETKRKLSDAHRGKILSDETKRRMSEAKRGKVLPNETKRKISEAMKGERNHNFSKPLPDETKRKISEAVKEYWKNRRGQKTAG